MQTLVEKWHFTTAYNVG